MTVIAWAGDTWGMAGPAFLRLYLVLVAGTLVTALVLRARALRGGTGAPSGSPTPVEVAYLNRGEGLALHTAVAGLRAAGAVDAGPGGTMVATGPFPAGGGDLDYAVHAALATPGTVASLRANPGVGNTLNRMREQLAEASLMVFAERRRAARAAAVANCANGSGGGATTACARRYRAAGAGNLPGAGLPHQRAGPTSRCSRSPRGGAR